MSTIGDNSQATLIDSLRHEWEEIERIKKDGYGAAKAIVRETKKTVLHRQVTIIGPKLLELRKKPDGTQRSDEEFGKLVCDNFEFLAHTNRHVRAAMMWAAEFPDQYQEMREEHPQCLSIRMLHGHWKDQEKENEHPKKTEKPKKPASTTTTNPEPTPGEPNDDDEEDDPLIDPEVGGNTGLASPPVELKNPATLNGQAQQLPALAIIMTRSFKGRDQEFIDTMLGHIFESEESARLTVPALVEMRGLINRAIDAAEEKFNTTYPTKDRMI